MNFHNQLLALIGLGIFAVASHAGIVEITVNGELSLFNGSDASNVDGASFAAVYRFDVSAPSSTDPDEPISFYGAPLFAQVAFTNRPNGAADASVGSQSSDRPLLRATNEVAPSSANDTVTVLSASLDDSGEFPAGLRVPNLTFDLGTADFFSGDQAPVAADFSTADVSAFSAGDFSAFDPRAFYEIINTTFSVALMQDSDNDGVDDASDNCTLAPNGPDLPDVGGMIQYDTNGDGFGNACDPDLNNDGVVDFGDLPAMQAAFFSGSADDNWNADADFNGDGVVDFGDLPVLQLLFFGPPGPSAPVVP